MAPPLGERSVCTCNCLCHSPRPASYLTCTLYQECSIDHGQPEVRLLTVRPGSLTDPLECDLSCVSLHAQPRFKALSYTWGGVDFKRTIVVNGHKVCITPNLYAALEHLRDLFSTAVLWVDAVCINQSDVRERNHQVSQMAMIYAAADEVISWLGEPADNSDLAMEFIASYTRSQRDVTRLRASATNRDSGLWLALVSLWSRPYWTRVWVVQEVAAARNIVVQCGHRCFPRDALTKVLADIRDSGILSADDHIWKPRRLLRLCTGGPDMHLSELLWDSAGLQATDSRDRVFGLLGIIPKRYREFIVPDYSQTFHALIQEIMQLYVKLERDLDVLCFFNTFTKRDGYPSWVPDITNRLNGIPPYGYFASAGRPANASISDGTLYVRGIIVGKVNAVIGPCGTPYTDDRRTRLLNFQRVSLKSSVLEEVEEVGFATLKQRYSDKTTLDLERRFWHMLAGHRNHEASGSSNAKCPFTCRQLWAGAITYEKGLVLPGVSIDYGIYFNFMFERLLDRCFFTTSNHHIGLGPPDMRSDDLVCVIYGCSLCIILRRNGVHHTFIGSAYVDGAMGGEYITLSKSREKGAPEEGQFSIR
jgi:hypothetical protein